METTQISTNYEMTNATTFISEGDDNDGMAVDSRETNRRNDLIESFLKK